jgi:hypothetical protein
VFDIDALGGGIYGYEAWCIFMRNLRPDHIIGCDLREGDTNETLFGSRREFCIAVFGSGLDVEPIKAAFTLCSEKGLAPPDRRFILSPQLDREPLVDAGMIDSTGRLVQREWTRFVHDECIKGGWGYAPRKVTVELSPELKAELKALQEKTVTESGTTGRKQGVVSQPHASKPWWKFWQ